MWNAIQIIPSAGVIFTLYMLRFVYKNYEKFLYLCRNCILRIHFRSILYHYNMYQIVTRIWMHKIFWVNNTTFYRDTKKWGWTLNILNMQKLKCYVSIYREKCCMPPKVFCKYIYFYVRLRVTIFNLGKRFGNQYH